MINFSTQLKLDGTIEEFDIALVTEGQNALRDWTSAVRAVNRKIGRDINSELGNDTFNQTLTTFFDFRTGGQWAEIVESQKIALINLIRRDFGAIEGTAKEKANYEWRKKSFLEQVSKQLQQDYDPVIAEAYTKRDTDFLDQLTKRMSKSSTVHSYEWLLATSWTTPMFPEHSIYPLCFWKSAAIKQFLERAAPSLDQKIPTDRTAESLIAKLKLKRSPKMFVRAFNPHSSGDSKTVGYSVEYYKKGKGSNIHAK